MQDDQDASGRIRFRKEISIGNLLTTLAIAVGAIGYFTTIERRIALVEQDQLVLHKADDAIRFEHLDSEKAMRAQLDRIDAKLDRLIEARFK